MWINWSAFLAQRKCKFQSWEHLEPFLLEVMGFSFPWPQCWLCQIESYCNHRQPSGSWGWTRGRKNPQTSKRWFFFPPRYYQEIVGREEEYATELIAGQEEEIKGCHLQQGCTNMIAITKTNESLISYTYRDVTTAYLAVFFSHRKNIVIRTAEYSSLKCFLKLIKPRHVSIIE